MRAPASDRLNGGEEISVDLFAPRDPRIHPEQVPLRIAYEDVSMLIVDKPAGMVVHPSAGHDRGTLVHALVGRAQAQGQPLGSIAGVERPGIVHRLDKDTSGLLVIAKSDAAQASLMAQFGDRSIEKEYLALVRGEPPAPRGRIEAPVGRDPRNRQRMAVVSGGREAVTEYVVAGAGGGYSLLTLHPRTGRTHQIRAHLAYLRLPIAGDLRYGGGIGPGELHRQFLHASRIGLRRPARTQLPPRGRAASRRKPRGCLLARRSSDLAARRREAHRHPESEATDKCAEESGPSSPSAPAVPRRFAPRPLRASVRRFLSSCP